MKFKIIFALFNVVVLASFLIIYFMPLLVLGWDYTKVFWSENWGLPILFVFIIGALNTYFIFNWRLFQLLEREDWEHLVEHLERRIYQKNLFLPHHGRILVNAYLVRSDLEGIGNLEAYIRKQRKRQLPRFALALGVPYLLKNDSEQMERYFSEFQESGGRHAHWLKWNYAFALILQGKREEACTELLKIPASSRDAVLALLVLYMLHSLKLEKSELQSRLSEGRIKLRGQFTEHTWARVVDRSKDNVQIVILSKLIEEATDWLFNDNESVPVAENNTVH